MEVAILSPIVSFIFCTFVYNEESYLRLENYKEKLSIFILFFFFFLGQTIRPDFFLYNFAIIISIFICRKNLNNFYGNLKFLFASTIGTTSGWLFIYFWRGIYFEDNIPNTYRLKVLGINPFKQIISGIIYTIPFLFESFFINLLLLLKAVSIEKIGASMYLIKEERC